MRKKGMAFLSKMLLLAVVFCCASIASAGSSDPAMLVKENVRYILGAVDNTFTVTVQLKSPAIALGQFCVELDMSGAPEGLLSIEDPEKDVKASSFVNDNFYLDDLYVVGDVFASEKKVQFLYMGVIDLKPAPIIDDYTDLFTVKFTVDSKLVDSDTTFPLAVVSTGDWMDGDLNLVDAPAAPSGADAKSFVVIKAFNAEAAANGSSKSPIAWDEQVTIASEAANFSFTDVDGNKVGGKVTAIGEGSQYVKIDGKEIELTDENKAAYGSFSFSKNSIVWNAPNHNKTMGHDKIISYTVPFVAASEDGAYTDKNTYTLYINPVDQPTTVILADKESIKFTENDVITLSAEVGDPDDEVEGGAGVALAGKVKVETDCGVSILEGTWEDKGAGKFTFTTEAKLSFEMVDHNPANEKNDEGIYVKPWIVTLYDSNNEEYNFESSADKATWVLDVDRPATYKALAISASPTVAYVNTTLTATTDIDFVDEDNDALNTNIEWFKSGTLIGSGEILEGGFAKNDTIKAVLTAWTEPYGNGKKYSEKSADSNEIEIQNSTPVVAPHDDVFVLKNGEDATVAIQFECSDADGLDDIEFPETSLQSIGTKLNDAIGGTFFISHPADGIYQVNFVIDKNADEFTDDNYFVFYVKDKDGAMSNGSALNVIYQANPQPELVGAPSPADGTELNESIVVPTEKQSLAATFKDGYIEGAPRPSGIKSVVLKSVIFTPEGGAEEDVTDKGYVAIDPVTPTTGDAECTATGAITLDPEILNGADRPAKGNMVIKVTVTDGDNVPIDLDVWKLVIKDTDRPAAAPTNLTVKVDGNEIKDLASEVKSGDRFTAIVDAADYDDPDGDDGKVMYSFKFDEERTYSAVLDFGKETDECYHDARKGDTVTFKAAYVSHPQYTDDTVTSEPFVETFVVKNTAPTIAAIATIELPEVKEETVNEEYGFAEVDPASEDPVGEKIVAKAWDIDLAVNRDTLSYSIADQSAFEEYGTVEIADKTLKFTINPYVNTFGLDKLPTITLKVTDDQGEEAECDVEVKILPVNDQPVLIAQDIYVVPDMMGSEQEEIFTVIVGVSKDEVAQNIVAASIEKVSDENSIFEGGVLPDWECKDSETLEKEFVLKYTIRANAPMGSEAVIRISVKDSSGEADTEWSEPVEVKFVLGATPWYPLYTIPADEHDAHQVTLVNVDNKNDKAVIIVEGDTLLPEHYYSQGIKGLTSGADYQITLNPWSREKGADLTESVEIEEPLSVSEYDVPGAGSLKVLPADDGGMSVKVIVDAPMASRYTLIISNENGKYATITKDFLPNEEGLIVPKDEFVYVFTEKGTYTFELTTENPAGKSAASEKVSDIEIVIPDSDEEWSNTGFYPEDTSINVAAGKNSYTVRFSWPIFAGAKKYAVTIIENGGSAFNREFVTTNNYLEASLPFSNGSTASFTWYVNAVTAKEDIASSAYSFSLVKASKYDVIEKVVAHLDSNTLELQPIPENVSSVEVQYAYVSNTKKVTWYDYTALKVAADGTVNLSQKNFNPGKDIVIIRLNYKDGKVSEWLTFTVK